MKRGALAAGASACGLLGTAGAQAHRLDTGLGPFADGVSHLLLSFDDLLAVVAMALLGGLNGAPAAKRVNIALPAAWLAGGAAGYLARHAALPPGTTSLTLLVLGMLVATDRRVSPAVITAIAGTVGLVHGWLNGAAIAAAGLAPVGLAGIVAATIALALLLAPSVARLRATRARIAIRVAGSWIAAIGLLFLGWALSGRL